MTRILIHLSRAGARSRTVALVLALASISALAGAGQCDLRVASGPSSKLYQRMVQDMATVCGHVVSLCAVASSGGLHNLGLLSSSQAEIGIVQTDILEDMKDTDHQIAVLQPMLPLHHNLLHVLALTAGSRVGATTLFGTTVPLSGQVMRLQKVSELSGLAIAVVGSAQLLGERVDKLFRLNLRLLVADSDDAALKMLRSGQVQAIFTLGGWPLPSVARFHTDSGLTLVDFDLEPKQPYTTIKRNYQALGAFNLRFLAAPNLLVTRPFKPDGTMGGRVAALKQCLVAHMDELQEGRYEAAWRDVVLAPDGDAPVKGPR